MRIAFRILLPSTVTIIPPSTTSDRSAARIAVIPQASYLFNRAGSISSRTSTSYVWSLAHARPMHLASFQPSEQAVKSIPRTRSR